MAIPEETDMTDWQHKQPALSDGAWPSRPAGHVPSNALSHPPGTPFRSSLGRRFWPPLPVYVVAVFSVAVLVSGCSSNVGSPAAQSSFATAPAAATRTTTAPTSGITLTGFGATVAQWRAAHKLDGSVPADNAYLPHIDREDTWQLVTVAGSRIISYTLNVAPSSLGAARARARQEMPADARALWTRIVPGTCAQEQFSSATLTAVLGDGQVNVEFDNATSGKAKPITEELFSTYNAPTVAQAPAC
jgi:hypothetical protein